MGDVAPPSDGGAAGGNLAGLLAGWHPQTPNINVLGALQQGQALEQARLQNQQVLAQRAAGMDYEGSINPLTGEFDEKAYAARLAQDPTAAFAAQKADANALANAHSAFNLHLGQMETLGRMAYNLAATKAPRSQINDALIDGVTGGILSPSQAATQIAELRAMPDDQLYPHLLAAGTQLLDQAHQGRQLLGEQQYINAGNRLVGVRTPVMGQAYASGGSIPLGLSPGEAVQPITLTTPTGQPVQVPAGEVSGGNLPPVSMGNGRPNPVAQAVNAYRNGGVAGPVPGTAESEKATAAQNAAIGTQIIGEGSDVTPTISNLEDLGAQIDATNPGPLAKAQAFYGSIASELGVSVSPQASSEQIFTKLTNMLATQNLSGLGQATDEKLNTILHATPNTAMTKEAAKTVLANAIGLQTYREARYKAYQSWLAAGNSSANAASFNEQFQNETSPLILGLQYMPPKQQVEVLQYISKLPKEAQNKFNQQLTQSQKMGLISW